MSNLIGGAGGGAGGVNKIGQAATGGVAAATNPPGTSQVPTGLAYVAATAQQVLYIYIHIPNRHWYR